MARLYRDASLNRWIVGPTVAQADPSCLARTEAMTSAVPLGPQPWAVVRSRHSEPHFEPTTLTVTEIGSAEELEEMIEAGNAM